MSITSAIRRLIDAGCSIEQALLAAEEIEKHAADTLERYVGALNFYREMSENVRGLSADAADAAADRRAKDAARKRENRLKNKHLKDKCGIAQTDYASENVRGLSADAADAAAETSSPSLSPRIKEKKQKKIIPPVTPPSSDHGGREEISGFAGNQSGDVTEMVAPVSETTESAAITTNASDGGEGDYPAARPLEGELLAPEELVREGHYSAWRPKAAPQQPGAGQPVQKMHPLPQSEQMLMAVASACVSQKQPPAANSPARPETPALPAKTAAKAPKSASGTRLPENWVLCEQDGNFALKEGFSREEIYRIAASFADYWHGTSGAKGRKADWHATWRNWVRREGDSRARQAARGGYNPPGKFAHLGNGQARGIAEALDEAGVFDDGDYGIFSRGGAQNGADSSRNETDRKIGGVSSGLLPKRAE